MEAKLKRLDFLLSKSMTYSSILATRLEESQKLEEKKRRERKEPAKQINASATGRRGKKRGVDEEEENESASTSLAQPPYITVPLREYQLQGVQWSMSSF